MAREAKTAGKAGSGAAEPAKPARVKKPPLVRETRRALLGKKLGMSQLFSEAGEWTPVTIIQAGPCTVLQVKDEAADGYQAVQIGFDDTSKPRNWPQQAYLEKIGVTPTKYVREVRYIAPGDILQAAGGEAAPGDGSAERAAAGSAVDRAEAASAERAEAAPAGGGGEVKPGVRVGVSVFKDVQFVDVRGVTKGRGFAGVIRRYHFNAGPKSHGSKNIREPGSTGMHTDPGRVHKGKRMPGHLGAVNRKARNLEVVRIEVGQNLLLVKGSVPGPNGGYLYIEESLKR